MKTCIAWLAVITVFTACKKSTIPDPAPAPVPRLTVADVSTTRQIADGNLRFFLILNRSSTNAVTVNYTLIDSTARSPRDYTQKSGTATIAAGQTSVLIEVTVKGNASQLREDNLIFNLRLSNPQGCTLDDSNAMGTIITENGTFLPTEDRGYSTPTTYPGYTLAWSDEFNGAAINASDWNFEIGNGSGGWGNNELEYYTNSSKNSFVSNGNLIIEARKEEMGGFNYTSTRMTTQNKRVFRHGRIDIRAKLPIGKGIWPALWMLGANINTIGWPACGEIDIMELVGNTPSTTHGTAHWKNIGGTNSSKTGSYNLSGGNFSQEFHVFSIIWEQDIIQWYVDDVLFTTVSATDVNPATYPFNSDQFFIFNLAVGGNWPGAPDNTTTFPKRMFVDYVRVFQR